MGGHAKIGLNSLGDPYKNQVYLDIKIVYNIIILGYEMKSLFCTIIPSSLLYIFHKDKIFKVIERKEEINKIRIIDTKGIYYLVNQNDIEYIDEKENCET